MFIILRWGLMVVLAFSAFIFHALNPDITEASSSTANAAVLAKYQNSSQPALTFLAVLQPQLNNGGDAEQPSTWTRVVIEMRKLVDGFVASVGASLEPRLAFGTPMTRGYASLAGFFGIIGILALLLGKQQNIDRPHDTPSFTLSAFTGRVGLIVASFFACAWMRDLAIANTGEAAILPILLISVVFAGFVSVMSFAR